MDSTAPSTAAKAGNMVTVVMAACMELVAASHTDLVAAAFL